MGLLIVLIALVHAAVRAASSEQWASRSIYQIVTDRFALSDGSTPACDLSARTYCGGTWKGIKNKLSYIQGMGFDAIWISPVVKNFDEVSGHGEAYHGYWTQDMNELNDHYGTSDDLKSLVRAVHDAGMLIMVDVTVNSLAWPGAHDEVDYSTFPAPFNTDGAFHPFCWVDWSNTTSTEECWMGDDKVALLDIYTQRPEVRKTYQEWVRSLIAEYDFDGIRIDALKSVEIDFFPEFLESAGVFALGENYEANPSMCCHYQSAVPGLLNFPVYWAVMFAFNATEGGMQHLVDLMEQTQDNCQVSLMGNFIENHDLKRYAGITSDEHQRLNALAFSFVNDGIPIVYYGQEQAFTGLEDPYNREALWTSAYDTSNPYYASIAKLNAVRQSAIARNSSFLIQTTNVLDHGTDYLVLKKGDLLSVLFNDGIAGSNASLSISKAYPPGTTVSEIISRNTTSTDENGDLTIQRNNGAPMIFWPQNWPQNQTTPVAPSASSSMVSRPILPPARTSTAAPTQSAVNHTSAAISKLHQDFSMSSVLFLVMITILAMLSII